MNAERLRTNIGLTGATADRLRQMKEEGLFGEMADGYRLGIALAMVQGQMADSGKRYETIFGVGTIDRDGSLRDLIIEVYGRDAGDPYVLVERLAEAGVADLADRYEANRDLRFGDIYDQVVGNVRPNTP